MSNQKVLFVDDEEGVRTSWSRYLSSGGMDVATAESVEEGIAQIETEGVSVIVSDLRMPGQDGLQFLDWVKATHPDIKFILLTGYGDDEIESKAKSGGAYDYLTKPISPDKMEEVIRNAFKQSEADLASLYPPPVMSDVEIHTAVDELMEKSRLRKNAEIVSGLIISPILGLAFVVFLPVIGFVAVIYMVGEKVYTKFIKVDEK